MLLEEGAKVFQSQHNDVLKLATIGNMSIVTIKLSTINWLRFVLKTTLSFLVVGFLFTSFCFLRNYVRARRTGLPLRFSLFSHMNPVSLIFIPTIARCLRFLDDTIPGLHSHSIVNGIYYASMHYDRGSLHERLGPVFMIVSPCELTTVVSGPGIDQRSSPALEDFSIDNLKCSGKFIAIL